MDIIDSFKKYLRTSLDEVDWNKMFTQILEEEVCVPETISRVARLTLFNLEFTNSKDFNSHTCALIQSYVSVLSGDAKDTRSSPLSKEELLYFVARLYGLNHNRQLTHSPVSAFPIGMYM